MSDAHDSAHDAPHEGPIKTPKQLIATVVASFVVPILIIILLINFVNFGTKDGAGTDALAAEATALRIQPIGMVVLKPAGGPAVLRTGEEVYTGQCSACHAAGALNAPKFGDASAWGPRIGQGYETLLTHALQGKGAMSAQGGGEYNDTEIGRAVVYMANKGGAKFDEPAVPAASASAASAP